MLPLLLEKLLQLSYGFTCAFARNRSIQVTMQLLTIFCVLNVGLLTKKFINLIKHAEDGMLDLNKAAETLQVLF